MTFKRTSMRFAHTTGYTHCCYTENGDRILTAGSDGDIRIWNGIDDDDPQSQCVGEFILSIIHFAERMLVSTDLNTVQAYTFPDGDRDGTELRFTAPVTCIKANKTFLASGSEDTLIKVVPVDKSEDFFELNDNSGPILHIDLSVNDLLASAAGDGTIRIWDLKTKALLKTLDGLDKVTSFYGTKIYVTPTFDNTGDHLAYIQKNEVIVVETSTWKQRYSLKDDKVSGDYSVCSYSPCGGYLAAGTTTGDISIWNVSMQQPLSGDYTSEDSCGITSIVWNPVNDDGELAYTDNSGQLGTVYNCFTNRTESIADPIENGHGSEIDFGDIEFVDDQADEDEDNENCVSLLKLKNETLKIMENNDEISEPDIDELLEAKTKTRDEMENQVEKKNARQSPFQPGETSRNLEHRYFVWNHVGIVRGHNTDTEDSIEVEFHDSSVHHSIHMKNYLHHTMASLSTTVLALACPTPSKLVCIALAAAAGSREWSVSMPNCEEILAVGASDKLIAVGTDARYIRLFSVMGTQREIISAPGPIISISGNNDNILIAYHDSPAIDDDQHISLMLIQVIGLSLRCRYTKVSLTPATKLTWIGYSDRGSPVTGDSMGMVRILNVRGNFWTPVCDTNLHGRGASDTFFIVNVSESLQIVRAILCRGVGYPLTNPQPHITELPMQLPMCDLETDKAILEESLLRRAGFNVDNGEQSMKEDAIKLFGLACKSEMEARAQELIEMIASPSLLHLAIKYASAMGRIHLQEKLNELVPHIEEQEQKRHQQMNDIEMEAVHLIQTTPMNASLLLHNREKSQTPIIAPKAMSLNKGKRNPFKRSIGTPKSSMSNPLSHLTDKAIGFISTPLSNDEPDDTSKLITISESQDLFSSEEIDFNDENSDKNRPSSTKRVEEVVVTPSTKPQTTFRQWFDENKDAFQSQHPDCSAAELTKHAMKEYLASVKGKTHTSESIGGHKRKIDENGDGHKQNGISKIARIGFKK